jgi:hypothetical protein
MRIQTANLKEIDAIYITILIPERMLKMYPQLGEYLQQQLNRGG